MFDTGTIWPRFSQPHTCFAPQYQPSQESVLRVWQGEAAEKPEEAPVAAVGGVDGLGFGVAVGLREHGFHAVLLLDAGDLAVDEVERLFPGNALVLARAAVLGVAPAWAGGARGPVWVPVDPLQADRAPCSGSRDDSCTQESAAGWPTASWERSSCPGLRSSTAGAPDTSRCTAGAGCGVSCRRYTPPAHCSCRPRCR